MRSVMAASSCRRGRGGRAPRSERLLWAESTARSRPPVRLATGLASHSASPASGVEKVLVIVEENRSVSDVAAHMPFLMSRARSYGTATHFYAISHPSLPNYLVLAGGSTFGVTDDDVPAAHQLHGPSLFGQLLAAGRTAKTYAEAMPSNCARAQPGDVRGATQPVDLLR